MIGKCPILHQQNKWFVAQPSGGVISTGLSVGKSPWMRKHCRSKSTNAKHCPSNVRSNVSVLKHCPHLAIGRRDVRPIPLILSPLFNSN